MEYFIGLDLGQQQDYTALVVLAREQAPMVQSPVTYRWEPERPARLALVKVERVALGTPIPTLRVGLRKSLGAARPRAPEPYCASTSPASARASSISSANRTSPAAGSCPCSSPAAISALMKAAAITFPKPTSSMELCKPCRKDYYAPPRACASIS